MKKPHILTLCLPVLALCLVACGSSAGSAPPFLANGEGTETAATLQTTMETTALPAPTELFSQAETSVRPETATEAQNYTPVSYKGLTGANFTLEDMVTAEGRNADFTFENNGASIYVYNDVTLDALFFTQVQYSYGETGNRISCTYTSDDALETVLSQWQTAMTALYGEPLFSDGLYSWQDGQTANVVTLTALNETTLQLAFYFNVQ